MSQGSFQEYCQFRQERLRDLTSNATFCRFAPSVLQPPNEETPDILRLNYIMVTLLSFVCQPLYDAIKEDNGENWLAIEYMADYYIDHWKSYMRVRLDRSDPTLMDTLFLVAYKRLNP